MKKLLVFALFVVALSSNSFADDKNKSEKESNVSYFAQNNFQSKYQEAKDVKWIITDEFQKAAFTLNGEKMSAFFNANGDYIATTRYVDANKLPASSTGKIQKYYKDFAIDEVVRYDFDGQDDSGLNILTGKRYYNTIYFASLKNKDAQMVVKITPDGDVSFLKNL